MRLFSCEYQNGLMSVKSKSESIQNVKMFHIFLLESLDASCKDYLISSVETLLYDWPKTNYNLPTRVQAEIDETAVLCAPFLLPILTHFHYLLVGKACIFFITTFSTRGNLLAELVEIRADY